MINRIPLLGLLLTLLIVSCTFTQKIKDGKSAYERKQFSVAVPMLKKEYNKTKSRIEKGKLAFMLAESLRQTNQSEASIPWYQIAYDNQYGVDALKEYAYALKKTQKYTEAKLAFKNLGIEIGSPYEYRKEITACNQAQEWIDQNKYSKYQVELSKFNSTNSDYAPSIYENGQLVFTSDRSTSDGDEKYNWTGNNFSDLFVVDKKSNQVEPFNTFVNTPNNEGTTTFNGNFSLMIFTRCYSDIKNADHFCKLMMSRKEGNSWTVPVMLSFVEEGVNYTHPSLSKDGGTLYFSSNHPDGWGGYDLYTSERSHDGWDTPQIMNRSINTIGNEKFPFIQNDTLYFSSDHHTGMGGLDIFRTYKMKKGKWGPVNNLKSPINSGADDFAFIIDEEESKEENTIQAGYFSSSRDNGKGNDDIYHFEKVIPPTRPVPPDTIKEKPIIVYKLILEGYVLENIYQYPDNPNSKILGRKPLANAIVQTSFNGKQNLITVGEDGFFTFEMDEEMDYNFKANKEGYLNNTGAFSTKGIGKDPSQPIQTFEIEIELDKIFKDKEITLENIYYDFDESFIRDDAKPTLNQLTNILLENPQINIQLSSHTDCQGNARYNETLSQKRAQAAVDYIISQGIPEIRLTAKGYGKSNLAIECICSRCSDDEHQANRRTTFKIVD